MCSNIVLFLRVRIEILITAVMYLLFVICVQDTEAPLDTFTIALEELKNGIDATLSATATVDSMPGGEKERYC